MAGRFIKLYDSILEWEWSRDVNTFRLFIQLLLKANYRDLRFEGRVIRRGQLVTSLQTLSFGTGLSIHQVRGSLDKLIRSGEASSVSYPRYRVITVLKYDEYQTDGNLEGSPDGRLTAGETAGGRQAEGRLAATSKEKKKYIEIYNTEREGNERKPAERFTQPSPEEVAAFCRENGYKVNAERFCDFYRSNGWMIGKTRMKDWRAAARNLALREDAVPARRAPINPACDFEQRDYSDVPDMMMQEMAEEIMRAQEEERLRQEEERRRMGNNEE